MSKIIRGFMKHRQSLLLTLIVGALCCSSVTDAAPITASTNPSAEPTKTPNTGTAKNPITTSNKNPITALTKNSTTEPTKNSITAPAPAATASMLDAESDEALSDAIQEYNAGHYDNAVSLLLQELKQNPDSGRAHYYLGSALKKVGADANAIHELEMAIKYCPPGTLQTLAKEALHGDFKDGDDAAAQPSQPNFFSGLFAFFQPPGSKSSGTSQSSATRFQMPDMFHPFNDAIKNTKNWVRTQTKPNKATPGVERAGQTRSDGIDTIPMGEMLQIAEDSKRLNPNAQSHPDGVMRFEQAPETSYGWGAWVQRFRKTFNNELFRHLAVEAKGETGGVTSVIFSVDNHGHLRGCVYSTSADDTVTSCVLKTIRELDRSYFLAFPPDSHITGWNFRMKWNFHRALSYIQYLRQRKAEALAAIAKVEAEQLRTAAIIKTKAAQEAERAKAKKLALLTPPPLVVKTGVSGQIMQKPKPVEMKAVQLKLSDMPPITDQDLNNLKLMRADSSALFR